MNLYELVDSYGVSLALFDNDLWARPGIYIDEINVIFVNKTLSEDAKKRVVCHELGHVEHDSNQYSRRHEQFELQANKHMIKLLMAEEIAYIDDIEQFNYVNFMQKHHLTTVADEIAVIDEYYNYLKVRQLKQYSKGLINNL